MFTKLKLILLAMTVGFALHISPQPVQAQEATIVLNESTCHTELGGTWSALVVRCSVTGVTIPAGTHLIILSDTQLNNLSPGTITNHGMITNDGAIFSPTTITNFGTFNNAGNIINTDVGSLINEQSGTMNLRGGQIVFIGTGGFTNHGVINNGLSNSTSSSTTIHGNTLVNHGTIVNFAGATLEDETDFTIGRFGTITNRGVINSHRVFTNRGTLTNHVEGTINSQSTFNNLDAATIDNRGSFNNSGNSVLDNNAGFINNSGIITNDSGSTIVNNGGTIANNGTINNLGQLNNRCRSTINGTPPSGNAIHQIPCRWDGSGGDNNWSNHNNWALDRQPGPQDSVLLEGTSTTEIILDLDTTLTNIQINNNFRGTLRLGEHTLTINGDFQQDGGTVDMETGQMIVTGAVTMNNGTFNPNLGKVVLNPADPQTLTAPALHDLQIGVGPVGLWKLNEGSGTTAHDASGNRSSGLVQGAGWGNGPTQLAENPAALIFDGSDDYVTLPSGSPLGALVNNFSFAGWIRPADLSGQHRIISSARTSGNQGWGIGTLDRGLRFTLYGVLAYDTTAVALAPNVWTHVAAVVSADSNVTFYINGRAIETVAGFRQGVPNLVDPFLIGATTEINSSDPTRLWFGGLDDLRVYGYAISDADVTRLAQGQELSDSETAITLGQPLEVTGNLVLNDHLLDVDATNNYNLSIRGNFFANGGNFAAQNGTVFFVGGDNQLIDASGISFNNVVFQNTSQGLVGYWPLDEQDFFVAQPEGGPTAFTTPDETANGTTGQGQGATQIAGPPVSVNALHFNGVNQRVRLGNPGVLNFTGQISLAAWVRPEVTEGTQSILAHGYVVSPQGEVALRIVNGNYQISSWDGVRHAATAPIPAEDVNSWVHLAGTYDGTTWRLYRNGVEIATRQDTTGAVQVNGDWSIGGRANSNDRFFQGGIDEVRIYNLALTPDTIVRLVEGSPLLRASSVGEMSQDEASAPAGRVQLLAPLHVAGHMTLEDGILDASAGNHAVTLGGDLTQSGGQFNARSGTMFFNGAAGTTQTIQAGQMTLADVEIGNDVTVSTTAAMMRTGGLNSQGQIQEMRQVDGEGELHYGLADITFNVKDATDFNSLAITRIDTHSPNAAVTTETGSHWLMNAEGEQYVVDMTLPHNNVNGPGVCQHLGNGEWDFFNDETTEESVIRHDVTSLDGEWAVGMTLQDPSGTESTQLFLPLVQR